MREALNGDCLYLQTPFSLLLWLVWCIQFPRQYASFVKLKVVRGRGMGDKDVFISVVRAGGKAGHFP